MPIKNKLKPIIIAIFSLIAGILGGLSGADNSSKFYRRIALPLLLYIIGLICQNYYSIIILSWCGILYIGYGVPDETDEGSALGRFFYKICKKNQWWTNFAVKLCLGVFFSLVLIPIAILSKSTHLLLITIPLTILSQILFGSLIKGLGEITLFKRKILIIEVARYTTLFLAGVIQLICGLNK